MVVQPSDLRTGVGVLAVGTKWMGEPVLGLLAELHCNQPSLSKTIKPEEGRS